MDNATLLDMNEDRADGVGLAAKEVSDCVLEEEGRPLLVKSTVKLLIVWEAVTADSANVVPKEVVETEEIIDGPFDEEGKIIVILVDDSRRLDSTMLDRLALVWGVLD